MRSRDAERRAGSFSNASCSSFMKRFLPAA